MKSCSDESHLTAVKTTSITRDTLSGCTRGVQDGIYVVLGPKKRHLGFDFEVVFFNVSFG